MIEWQHACVKKVPVNTQMTTLKESKCHVTESEVWPFLNQTLLQNDEYDKFIIEMIKNTSCFLNGKLFCKYCLEL